jgi:hypothetical protein
MHATLPVHLRVAPQFDGAVTLLRHVDPDLRVRKSAEHVGLYVLERRCRRAPAVNTGMRDLSDMHVQARDGYIHVSTVHPNWLTRPWNIVRVLKQEGADLWAEGGFDRLCSEEEYEERWAKETRRRRRQGLYRDIAKEAYDVLSRMNHDGERSRINNVGTRPLSHADSAGPQSTAA